MAFPHPLTDPPAHAIDGARGQVRYRRWRPDGPPRRLVALAHGYAEHSGRYDHVAEALVARGALVIAPDHLGHGHSEGDRALIHDLDDLADDLHAVLRVERREHPDLPVAVLGHSLGGLVAVRLVQRTDEDLAGLALSSPVLGDWAAARTLLEAEEIPDAPIDPATLSREPSVGAAYAEDPLVYRGPFKRPTLQAIVTALEAASQEADRVTLPVLHLHGGDDALVPPEPSLLAAQQLGSSDLDVRVLDGARHEVLNETDRDRTIAAVADFLDRVTG